MSVVIAIKDRDRIILGADKQVSSLSNKFHNAIKVWKLKGYDGEFCMGGVGSHRCNQLIKSMPDLLTSIGYGTKEIDTDLIVNHLAPLIYEVLNKYQAIPRDEDGVNRLENEFFFAYKDRCWKINHDLSVIEVEDYDAIGSGQDNAVSSIDTAVLYGEENPFKAMSQAIAITAYRTLYVNNFVDFITTKDYEEDQIEILEATDPEAAEILKAEIKTREKEAREAKKKAKEEAKAAEEKAKLAAEKKANKKKQKLVEEIKEAQ